MSNIIMDLTIYTVYSPTPQKYWSSKVNSFVFTIHCRHFGLRSKYVYALLSCRDSPLNVTFPLMDVWISTFPRMNHKIRTTLPFPLKSRTIYLAEKKAYMTKSKTEIILWTIRKISPTINKEWCSLDWNARYLRYESRKWAMHCENRSGQDKTDAVTAGLSFPAQYFYSHTRANQRNLC